jgi:hypothetical protein
MDSADLRHWRRAAIGVISPSLALPSPEADLSRAIQVPSVAGSKARMRESGLTLTRIVTALLRFNNASVAWKPSGSNRRGACANCLQTAATSSAIHRCCADPAGGAAPAQPHRYVDRSRPLHGGVPRVGRHTCDTRTGSLRRACILPTAAVAPRHSESAALSELAQPRNCRS